MSEDDKRRGARPTGWLLLGLLVALLVTSVVPGYTQRGEHGGGGGHGHEGRGGPRVVGPRFGVSIWPYWSPYWDPYVAPPIIVNPAPPVVITPTPQIWYYCNNPPGYYPEVPACPGGWLPVVPPSP